MRGAAVDFIVEGLNLERFFTLARAEGLTVGRMKRLSPRKIRARCGWREAEKLRALAQARGYAFSELPEYGMKKFMSLLKARPGLWAGAILFLGLLIFSFQFVWRVEIAGAGKHAGEARLTLDEMGAVRGALWRELQLKSIGEKLESRLPHIAWARAEMKGTTLLVTISEGSADEKEETAPCDVVAGESGILVRLSTYAGTPIRRAGELVKKGDILIEGRERGAGGEWVRVRARGAALARVWESASARVPAMETVSTPTGKTYTRVAVRLHALSLFMSDEPDYLTWDMEPRELPAVGAWWPVTIRKEIYNEAVLSQRACEEAALQAESSAAALRILREKLRPGDELVDKWIEFSMIQEGSYQATATMELLRNIALGGTAPNP